MAIAKICDKCGHVIPSACDCEIKVYIHPFGETVYELCNECKNEVLEWIKSGNCKNGYTTKECDIKCT